MRVKVIDTARLAVQPVQARPAANGNVMLAVERTTSAISATAMFWELASRQASLTIDYCLGLSRLPMIMGVDALRLSRAILDHQFTLADRMLVPPQRPRRGPGQG